jgi:hypothetical protein
MVRQDQLTLDSLMAVILNSIAGPVILVSMKLDSFTGIFIGAGLLVAAMGGVPHGHAGAHRWPTGAHDRGDRHNMQCHRMLKERGSEEGRPAT